MDSYLGRSPAPFQRRLPSNTTRMNTELHPLILLYHSISLGPPPLCISPTLFAGHIAWLKSNAHIASLSEAVDFATAGEPLPPNTVVLTFDDGFADFYSEAAPILRRAGLPATVFLPSGFCGRTNAWPTQPAGIKEQPLLAWVQIGELAQQGVEFGSHSVTHPVLTELSEADAMHEIHASKTEVEAHTGGCVRFFAYPYGKWNPAVRELVRQEYRGACSAILGRVAPTSDPFALPRVDAYYLRSPAMFRGIFSPALRRYFSVRRLARRVRYGGGF